MSKKNATIEQDAHIPIGDLQIGNDVFEGCIITKISQSPPPEAVMAKPVTWPA